MNQLTVARREAKMVTNSFCERGVATTSEDDDVADHFDLAEWSEVWRWPRIKVRTN